MEQKKISEISRETCCGNCLWYNGDMRDEQAFCDDKEDYVSVNHFCYRHIYAEEFDVEENNE